MDRNQLQSNLNAIVVLILCGVLLSAFGVQFVLHEQPCPLCLLQRLGMIGVGACLLMNVFLGIRPAYYGLALICALVGGTVALRQISLHVCPGFHTFGIPILGLSLYTWSFVVFTCVVLSVALLLFLYDPRDWIEQNAPQNVNAPLPPINWLGKLAFSVLLFVAVANVISTLFQCGLGPCAE